MRLYFTIVVFLRMPLEHIREAVIPLRSNITRLGMRTLGSTQVVGDYKHPRNHSEAYVCLVFFLVSKSAQFAG